MGGEWYFTSDFNSADPMRYITLAFIVFGTMCSASIAIGGMVFLAVEINFMNIFVIFIGTITTYLLLLFLRVQIFQPQITIDSQGVHFVDKPYLLPKLKVDLPFENISSFAAGCDGLLFYHKTGYNRLRVLFRNHNNNLEIIQVRNWLKDFGIKEVPGVGLGPSLDPTSYQYRCP